MCMGLAIAAEPGSETVSVKSMADALHMVMDSDRTVYTKKIVNRLDEIVPAVQDLGVKHLDYGVKKFPVRQRRRSFAVDAWAGAW